MAVQDDLNTPVIAVVGLLGAILLVLIIVLLMVVYYHVASQEEYTKITSQTPTLSPMMRRAPRPKRMAPSVAMARERDR